MEMQGLDMLTAGEEAPRKLRVKGLFYGIGHRPNSDLVKGQVKLSEGGYVEVGGQGGSGRVGGGCRWGWL